MNQPKPHCQRAIEGKSPCINQCDHCKEYFKPLEMNQEFCVTHQLRYDDECPECAKIECRQMASEAGMSQSDFDRQSSEAALSDQKEYAKWIKKTIEDEMSDGNYDSLAARLAFEFQAHINAVYEGGEEWKAQYENLLYRIKNTKPWPVGAYAPGNYSCKCCYCEKSFIGDKRAVSCLDCALSGTHVYVENLRDEIASLQSQLSSMTDNYQRAFAERDAAYEENRKLLLKTAQLRKVENETNLQEIMDIRKERDFALKELQTWKDECNTLSAILEGKNLENAELKQLLKGLGEDYSKKEERE